MIYLKVFSTRKLLDIFCAQISCSNPPIWTISLFPMNLSFLCFKHLFRLILNEVIINNNVVQSVLHSALNASRPHLFHSHLFKTGMVTFLMQVIGQNFCQSRLIYDHYRCYKFYWRVQYLTYAVVSILRRLPVRSFRLRFYSYRTRLHP